MLREQEFKLAKTELMETLYAKFYWFAKKAGVVGNKKQFVEDLMAKTLSESLRLSFMEQHAHRSCRWIIKMKANNVWRDEVRHRARTLPIAEESNIEEIWSPQDLQEADKPMHPKIEWLLEHADEKSLVYINRRLEGYQVKEIAAMYQTTPGAISQHFQRLKLQFQKR